MGLVDWSYLTHRGVFPSRDKPMSLLSGAYLTLVTDSRFWASWFL